MAITANAIIDNHDKLFERPQVEREYQKEPGSLLILLAYEELKRKMGGVFKEMAKPSQDEISVKTRIDLDFHQIIKIIK